MVLQSIMVGLLAVIGPAEAGRLAISQDMLTGTWECGPTAMKGPQFAMTVLSVTKRAADQKFVTTTTTVLMPSGRSPITLIDLSRGTWRLDGRTLIWVYQESKFISSSDPIVSAELGQKIQDDQLRKKSIYKSEILEIDRKSMRSIPVDSDYADAVVVSKCRRT